MIKRNPTRCGIMPFEMYRQRTMDIVAGKYIPGPDEPKIWFDSPQTMGHVLCRGNIDLLKAIIVNRPQSIRELARVLDRAPGNLHRTLKMLEGYGIVSLEKVGKTVTPKAEITDFQCTFGVSSYHPEVFEGEAQRASV